jgi:two-component system, chemotaxis family, protein-glutamate methylesterase/glutaminase
MGTRRPTLVLVDDDRSFLEALEEHLRADGRIEVVGRAANGVEAVALVEELRPDLVSMDLDMPVMDGVEATKSIVERHRPVSVVIVSGSSYPGDRNVVLDMGAAAVLSKSRVYNDLVETLLGLACA